MSAYSVGIRVWFRTVILNGIFWGIAMLGMSEGYGILLAFAFMTIGLVVTAPLLLLIIPVIRVSKKLPYNITSRMAWATFILACLVVLIYILSGFIIEGRLIIGMTWLNTLLATILLALLVTMVSVKRAFVKFYTVESL